MTPAIIIDLDGTLYDCTERRERCFPPGGKKDFERWNSEAEGDPPHAWCVQLVQAMRATGAFPLFVSGRDRTYEAGTRRWLLRHLNLRDDDYALHLRPAKDYRQDAVLKREIYDQHIHGKWQVWFAVDDRKRVVDMWRELGLTCLHCAEGDFF